MNSKELAEYFDKQVDRFIAVTKDYKDAASAIAKAQNELDTARDNYKYPKLDALKKFVFIIWPLLIVISVAALDHWHIPGQYPLEIRVR